MDIHTNPSEATWTRNLVERSAKPVSEPASELARPLARASVGAAFVGKPAQQPEDVLLEDG